MKLTCFSITYHDCPIDDRELLSLGQEGRYEMMRQFHRESAVEESVIIETCNRLEFYMYARAEFNTVSMIQSHLEERRSGSSLIWNRYVHVLIGQDAIHHLFHVAAGLDSQMIGENQVLAQVKKAYSESVYHRMSRVIFHKLFHMAFRVGKAVRTQTHINDGAVSIALAAVELIRESLEGLHNKTAMVVGAGENAKQVIKNLIKYPLKELYIVNRHIENAYAIIEEINCRGKALDLSEGMKALKDVNCIISTTGSQELVFVRETVERSLSDSQQLIMVDIAVPRDIEPDIGRLSGVSLYNIDDLDRQIAKNKQHRSEEIPKAQEIVMDFTREFMNWFRSLNVVPVIQKLTHKGLSIARQEAHRYARQSQQEQEALTIFAESLVRKLLHDPIQFIKAQGEQEPGHQQIQAIEWINTLFQLHHEDDKDG